MIVRFLILLWMAVIAPIFVSANHGVDCDGPADAGNYFYNSCEEKCICEETEESGEWVHNCYRQREEFASMSPERRKRYIMAYKNVTTYGNPGYQSMVDMIENHLFNYSTIHGFSEDIDVDLNLWFLPFHRWYLREVEDIMRNVDCRITVPWFRWSGKPNTWWQGKPFIDKDTWLGGNGVISDEGCMQNNGPFSPPWNPPYPSPHECLHRVFKYNVSVAFWVEVNNVLDLSPQDYTFFSTAMQMQVHGPPHNVMGGDMPSALSPRDPTFFLHHAYIDRLWDIWQKKSDDHLYSFTGNIHDDMQYVLGQPWKTIDFFDLGKTGVQYVDYKPDFIGTGHKGKPFISQPFSYNDLVVGKFSDGKPQFYQISAIENAALNSPEKLKEVPQLELAIPSLEALRPLYNMSDPYRYHVYQRVVFAVQRKELVKDSIPNQLTKEELAGLDNRLSMMFGLDFESDEFQNILRAAGVCDIASELRAGVCIRNDTLQEEIEEGLKNYGMIVDGEILPYEDLLGF